MANTAYDYLQTAVALSGPEIVSIMQGGTTCRITMQTISNYFLGINTNDILTQSVNLKASLTSSSSTLTITADQVVLGATLSNPSVTLNSFNQSNNLSTTGAGGLDTGTISSGYAAVYAIYNTGTLTTSTLATDSTSSVAPEIYAGVHMPSGYTLSRLLGVYPVVSASTYSAIQQSNRRIAVPEVVFTTNVGPVGWTSLSISTVVPPNAVTFSGRAAMISPPGLPGYPVFYLSPAGSSMGQQVTYTVAAAGIRIGENSILDMPIITTQTTYYQVTPNNFDAGGGIGVSSYTF